MKLSDFIMNTFSRAVDDQILTSDYLILSSKPIRDF